MGKIQDAAASRESPSHGGDCTWTGCVPSKTLRKAAKVDNLSNTHHVYRTYSIAGMQASAAIRVERLLNGTTGRVVRGLARLMR